MERIQDKINMLFSQVKEYLSHVEKYGLPPFSHEEVLKEYIKISEKYHKCMSYMYSLDLLNDDEYYDYAEQLEYLIDKCYEEIKKMK